MISATNSSISYSILGSADNLTSINSSFTNCSWTSARNAVFTDCTFVRCDFSSADLEGINLSGSTYDLGTGWPEGFVPEEHGARLADGELERMEERLADFKRRQP